MRMEDSPQVKRYHRLRRLLSVAGFILELGLLLVLLLTGWTVSLRAAAERVFTAPALALLVYLFLFGVLSQGIGLPLDFLRGYWLEHRYGLSNLTFGGWVKDVLKGWAVGGVLACLALEFVYATLRHWPGYWWIICGLAFIAFFVLLANLAPVLLLPIFYKFQPLENPALVARLLDLSRRAGTRVQGVFEWKLSEKSKKANAALVGLGNTRRIILSDTLLAHFSAEEVEAVLAHEFGHHVRHHLAQAIAVQALATFLGFYLVDRVLVAYSRFFGFAGLADFANLPLLVLLSAGLSLMLLPVVNTHSRYMERQADRYALEAIPERTAFISGMDKLSTLNLAERRPHPWIEFIFHSHPSIEKRIAFAQKL